MLLVALGWGGPGCSGVFWAALGCSAGCSGVFWAALGCSGVLWAALGCFGLLRAALGCSGAVWGALGCFGVLWGALESTELRSGECEVHCIDEDFDGLSCAPRGNHHVQCVLKS